MPLEGRVVGLVGWTGDLRQAASVPLENYRTRIEDPRARKDDHVAVGLQRSRTVGDVIGTGKIRTCRPCSSANVVNGRVTCRAAVSSRIIHRAVWHQDPRT